MKEYLTACTRLPVVIVAMTMATAALVSPQPLQAQSTSQKVRLMADTLRARDAGNLEVAKEKAEELITIAPNDENVQRLLNSINNDLEKQSGGTTDAEPVYGKAPELTVEEAMEVDPAASQSEGVIAVAAAEQAERIEAAKTAIDEAKKLAELGAYEDAQSLLDSATASLTLNTATAPTLDSIQKTKANLILNQAKALAKAGELNAAEGKLEEYYAAGGKSSAAKSFGRSLDKKLSDPYAMDINEVSPEFAEQDELIRDLLARGRAQFLNGDYDGAQATFKEVEARDANNAEAKLFQTRIAVLLGEIHGQNHNKTREQMMTEVDQAWERPKVFDVNNSVIPEVENDGLQEKIENIIIPQVNFSDMQMTRVIETLSELSTVYDPQGKGVNIIPLFNSNETNPRVSLTFTVGISLDKVLQYVTAQVGFNYDVRSDAVTVDTSDSVDGASNTITEFFPLTRATVIRLTGVRGGGGSSSSTPVDPFSAPAGSSSGPSASEETEALQSFFQSAGVNFELPGTTLAFDGEQLIVTQTRRNLERMRNILRNYNEVKQVEIEAKFLEVAQNDLDELGFNWSVNDGGRPVFQPGGGGFPQTNQYNEVVVDYQRRGQTVGRTLNDAFRTDAATAAINISGLDPIPVSPPILNTAIDLGSGAGNVFGATGWSAAGLDVELFIRALSRKTGTDLMSAPKVTVLSGKKANITVAQELRYPESYGDIESQASSSNSGGQGGGGGGSSSISITAGTPQDFVTRNVGVELAVTPNVENDDTISLLLEPRVTEFEGFVEYGGPSVAVTGGSAGSDATVVTVPAGFYQPVFSTREMSTEVTVFDGATLVMGGLTRDEVKTVNDKVPVLGDIPGVGRLFRSEGETRQKRNLLIFVTANMISPGGSPARQNYRNVDANSLFQNPTIMTPSGSANRSINKKVE